MKNLMLAMMLALCCAVALGAADNKMPRMTAVEPDSGKVGDVAVAKGENLEKSVVTELYLTDGKKDVKVVITDQAGASITFKIPAMKAGRYRLMTASKSAMVEQPVMFEIGEQ